MPSSKGGYRHEIDGLRAIAVLAVILNHLHEDWLPGGFLGVDVFFVISGYVITASIEGRAGTSLGPFLKAFYRRRVQRLAPALMCCIAITGMLTCLFVNNPASSLITGATALVGVSNLYLFAESTNYFGADASYNTFLQTWSLGVEEQFYLCFPVLAWWLFQRRGKGGRLPMLSVLTTLSLISLLGYVHGSIHNPAGAYFLTPLRLWELLTGALVQQGALRRLSLPAIAPMALLILSFWLNSDPPLTSTLLAVAATALLLPALEPPSRVKSLLSLPSLRHLGRLSYSLYLWHWSVICLARWTIGLEGWRLPLLLLAMFSCAEASYLWVETPLRHRGWAKSTRGTLLGVSGLTAVLGGLMLWLAQDGRSQKLYFGQPTLSVREALSEQQISGSTISHDNCHLSKTQSISDPFVQARAQLCVTTPTRQNMPTVYVAGDSHASALMPLESDLLDMGYGIGHLSMNGCPFPATRYGHLNENCSDIQNSWGDWILENAKPGDAVLIHGFWLSHLGRGIGNTRDELIGNDRRPVRDSDKKRQLFIEAVNGFSAQASAKGIHVVVLGAGPRLRDRGRCLPEWFRPAASLHACERSLQKQLTHAREMNAALSADLSPNITFIDPVPALCTAGCSLNSMRHLLFDDDHLSAQGAKQLLPPVLAKLSRAQS